MDRVHRLTVDQSSTDLFICPTCSETLAVSADDMCDFCWYDFQASNEERRLVNESSTFRELSVHRWYAGLHITKLSTTLISPVTVMHVLHDCFRLSPIRPTVEDCLQRATIMFPESVSWLRRLLRGALPVVKQSISTEKIYKFAAGIGRTPIWYRMTKNVSDSRTKWFWTPYNPIAEFDETMWLKCPQLLVSVGDYKDQVPVTENIFLILFLHTFRPAHPAEDVGNILNFDQTTKHYIREDILRDLPNFSFRTN